MSYLRDYQRSLLRCADARTRADRPKTFTMRGRKWDLLEDVFAPVYSPSTSVFLDFVDFPAGGSVLEMGCGCGVIAVEAALAGCRRVVAADINPNAVMNTRRNAARHGVADRVSAVWSDLFTRIPPAERFDLVLWNSNYVLAPDDYRHGSIDEHAYVDPGYQAHRRFLEEAGSLLADGGSVLLNFSSRGDLDTLERIAATVDRRLWIRQTRTVREGAEDIEYRLLEVTATDRAPAEQLCVESSAAAR